MATVPRSPDKQLVHLLVTSGPDKGRMFFVKPGKDAVIGRAASVDLRLTDTGSSARHCAVRSAGDMLFIEDLQSSNGTRLNGDLITERVLDEDGILEIGESTIEISWVATEREIPLASVESGFAPTLLEMSSNTARIPKPAVVGGSTILGADQLVQFRIAQKQLGSTLGGFMLLEVIGMGSLGFVFRAKNIQTREEIALKVIPHAHLRSLTLLDRFIKECRTGLDIPGAANLLSVSDTPEASLIAMKLERGRSLQSMIEGEHKFTVREAASVVVSLSKALQAGHQAGVIHRDVKPANILVREDGSTVLLDLGMGRKQDGEGRSILAHDDRLESVAFNSPELTRQSELDGRADVYALGAVLFCMLSGHRPFAAKTHIELIRKIRWESPPNLSEKRPDITEAMNAVINRALDKDAPGRYADMSEFAAAVKAALQ